MAGIYIHVPFCKQLCSYCDFYFSVSLQRKDELLSALCKEIEYRKDYLNDQKIDTLYIGGGTPTVYSPEELQQIIDQVKSRFNVTSFSELTIEANPDDLSDEYLEKLSLTDINRLSIGIQSFNDDHLKFFNRRHNAEQAYQSVIRAKAHGFENITVDLIYGIPDMTNEQWNRNLDLFFELDIPHLSAYHLTIEERTVFGKLAKRGKLRPVEDSVSMQHYEILEKRCAEAGFTHYEISNFFKSEKRAVHNSNYWKGVPYIGIGPSAHSYNGTQRRWNISNNIKYLEKINSGDYFETETLTEDDLYNEYIMTSLRTAEGVDLKIITDLWGEIKAEELMKNGEKFIKNKTLILENNKLCIPSSKFLMSDYVISELFYVTN